MISIICCCRDKLKADLLIDNIRETIGCIHEIILIDNSSNQYSIFKAYNIGIGRSKYPYLCFIHDDVVFHTNNWGQVVLSVFSSNKKIGLIGIAGSTIKTKAPSGWWQCDDTLKQINIIQHSPNNVVQHWKYGTDAESIIPVATIDGVFMSYRKEVGSLFDEKMEGFHGYDLALSLDVVKKGYINVVTKQIDIEHFSLGTINKNWYLNTLYISNIYKNLLPIKITNDVNIAKLEYDNSIKFISSYFNFGISWAILIIWIKLFFNRPNDRAHVLILKKFIKIILKYRG